MAAKKTSTVTINAPEFEVVEFKIVGDTPLIVHAWDEKAKRMMLEKQMGKAAKTKHEIKVPTNDFINSLYWLTEKPQNGIDDADAAAELTGCDVFFPRSMADDAPDDEVSVAEIIGYDVVDANSGQRVGAITRIDDATMNTLFEVETPDGRLVDLPANAELVKDISRQTRTVTLVIPDGVMDL